MILTNIFVLIFSTKSDVIFISELYLGGFLSRKIIEICISSLLYRFLSSYKHDKATNRDTNKASEDHLEALIVLLERVGRSIEEREKKSEARHSADLKNETEIKPENILYVQCELAISTKENKVRLPQEGFKIVDVVAS